MFQVVDIETEQTVGPNTKGELRLKSDIFMNGYYKTDSTSVYDAERFLKTGDIVQYDENGCLYILARIKEMFKFKGIHIIPLLLEKIILTHPSVQECSVVGIADPIDGDRPIGVVVLKNEARAVPEEIENYVNERVYHNYKLVGGVKFVDRLPRNSNGKIIRSIVKNMLSM